MNNLKCKKKLNNYKLHWLKFIFSFIIFIFLLTFPLFPSTPKASTMLAIVVLMGFLWIFETLPIGITALLPLVLFPIFEIENTNAVSINYCNSTIFLFLGGFILSIAIEDSGLHRQISTRMIKLLGFTKYGVLIAFIFSTFGISMFISNTATALIIIPIALSITNHFKSFLNEEQFKNFSKAILFAVAYSASIGGTATLIGTPPNLIFQKVYQISFPKLPQITFASFLFMVLPLALLMGIVLFLILNLFFLRKIPKKLGRESTKGDLLLNESFTTNQKIVAFVFVLTCLLWIFRSDILIGQLHITGWSNMLGLYNFIDDGTVAIFAVFILFVLTYRKDEEHKNLLSLSTISKVPWDIILLFGGGFALADGFEKSGLSKVIASQISTFIGIHPLLLMIITCTLVVAMTEFSSNTAVASTFLPLIASISAGLGISPLKIMIPATISASYAFMLPISTPPNAIVFSFGIIKITEMVRVGIFLNLIGIILVSLYFYLFF